MGADSGDSTSGVLPHTDADIGETPGKRLRIMSIEAWYLTPESLFEEQVYGHEGDCAGVIPESTRRPPTSFV